jgi:GntR family transcriptional regulator, transcriptional repressor for pyruvate dehydrogenase complex
MVSAMDLQPVARRSVADDVFDQLLGAVVTGGVAAGDPLPSERALAERFAVNRQAVREAIQRLAQAGVVDVRQGGATRVRDVRATAGLDLLPQLLVRGGRIDTAVVRAVMELRACLGPDAARRCAERALPVHVAAVQDAHRRMEGTDDLVALARLDLELWDHILEGADNIAYRLAYNSLRATYEPVLDLVAPALAVELADRRTRAAMVRAIAAHEPQPAARAAARLLAHGTAGVTAALTQEEPR